jgi:hypothetical protein
VYRVSGTKGSKIDGVGVTGVPVERRNIKLVVVGDNCYGQVCCCSVSSSESARVIGN